MASAGSVSGTVYVVLVGGPPEWDGTVTAVSRTSGALLERWCHTSDLAYLWKRTGLEQEVEVESERRSGTVLIKKDALVYEAIGYREDQE